MPPSLLLPPLVMAALRWPWPIVLLLVLIPAGEGQLSYSYYAKTCPNVEGIVRDVIGSSLMMDPTARAALTRLVFHDCQVTGCDASITLESAPGKSIELQAGVNLGIRRLDLIHNIKVALEAVCPKTVSCADIVVLAGRDAILLSGGPTVIIPLGRRDGFSASISVAQQHIPPSTITVANALSLFSKMGMTTFEAVAIIGAHTIGIAHCINFANRLYPARDPHLGTSFAATLRAKCPPRFNITTFVNLDATRLAFDNQYFHDILNGRGLLTIDSELGLDPRTSYIVAQFANNPNLFFQNFATAFVKMSSYKVLTGIHGEIRQNCRRINGRYPNSY